MVGFAALSVACGSRAHLESADVKDVPAIPPPRVTRDVREHPMMPFQPTSDVSIGVIRWDGAPSDPMIRREFGIGPALVTRYAHLEPVLGWYLYGQGIDTQTIVDTEILEDD